MGPIAVGPRPRNVRPSALAGTWYPKSSVQLQEEVDQYLGEATFSPEGGKICGLVVPHAGYTYSGAAAAYGYKVLEKGPFTHVVVMGPSHTARFRGASIPMFTHYETPLGQVEVDRDICDRLLADPSFNTVAGAHIHEHCLEIQLPFLQRTLGEFKLVPILIGDVAHADCDRIALVLREACPESSLFIASSDFTHYGRRFDYVPFDDNVKENLENLDLGAAECACRKDFDAFFRYVEETGATICGRNPIGILLKLMPEEASGEVARYYTSGHITGDFDHCVSYATLVFSEKGGQEPEEDSSQSDPVEAEVQLSPEMRKFLLQLARRSIENCLAGKETGLSLEDPGELSPELMSNSGAFVTLKCQGSLRGCIGYVEPTKPLFQTVMENAVNAATKDPRFSPLDRNELESIRIEISVLSPLKRLDSPDEIVVNRDGLVVEKGTSRGLLLPQVATENHWDSMAFLRQTCRKAGLPEKAWRDGETSIYSFTAQVFGE